MHHSLDCANSWLNSESHWLVNGSFLLTESFCKNYLFSISVTSLWCTCDLCEPFLSGAPHAHGGAPCTPVEERWSSL